MKKEIKTITLKEYKNAVEIVRQFREKLGVFCPRSLRSLKIP